MGPDTSRLWLSGVSGWEKNRGMFYVFVLLLPLTLQGKCPPSWLRERRNLFNFFTIHQ